MCLKIDKEVVLEDKPCILVSKPNLLGIRWFRSIWACCYYYYYGSLMLKCLPCVSLRCVCTCFLLISNGVIFYLPFLRSFLHFDLISTHCSSLLPSFYKCYFFFFLVVGSLPQSLVIRQCANMRVLSSQYHPSRF